MNKIPRNETEISPFILIYPSRGTKILPDGTILIIPRTTSVLITSILKSREEPPEYLFKWRERGDDEERENKLRYEFNAALAMKVAPIFREFRDTRKQIMG